MQHSVAIFCLFSFGSHLVFCGKKDIQENCRICKTIVENFEKGVKDTHKSNFGGGNTNWEEKSLGTYANSETRLVEIMENLCSGGAKECHHLLETHEEDIEEYWFKVFAKKKDKDLNTWLCIERIKVCCPSNTYGPTCKECPGGKDRPCKGNGKCDGEGTRAGKGKCKCDSGYKGDLCDDCTDKYFEAQKNDTHTTCSACHESCKSTCWEAGPKGCDECKTGWKESEDEGCIDINECEESFPCGEDQYCTNTPGKYNCATCHRSCSGCDSYGADKCKECAEGYILQNQICADINECEEDKSLCTGDKQHCENKDGTYECVCEEGFILDSENICIPKPKDEKDKDDDDDDDLKTEKEEL